MQVFYVATILDDAIVPAGPSCIGFLISGNLRSSEVEQVSEWKEPVDLKEGSLRFAVRMYHELSGEHKGNLFFSPLSMHAALAMTYAGAKGATAAEMARALDYPIDAGKTVSEFGALLIRLSKPRSRDNKPAYQLNVVNALWGQTGYPFAREYADKMNKVMAAKLESLDFGQLEPARKRINDWIDQQTNHCIVDVIPQGGITPVTRLVLTNSIYFKSAWADDYFKAENTKKAVFHASDHDVEVELMHTNREFIYAENDACQIVGIPYKDDDLRFILVLPRKKDGLADLERQLTPGKVQQWMGTLFCPHVELALPRFKFENSIGLKPALRKLGMLKAFGVSADFSGMLEKPCEGFNISEALHKSFVALDENGTEAAAATALMLKGEAAEEPERVTVTADHPFLFLIDHPETGDIIFMGRVDNPTVAADDGDGR